MMNIPLKSRINESGIKYAVFILENPKSAIPNSSGRGEAIIKAPKSGVSQRKSLSLNTSLRRLFRTFFSKKVISSAKESLIKRKTIKSPRTPPKPPKKATSKGELDLANSNNTTPAGAAVKAEIKKIPAIKLVRIFISLVVDNIPSINPVLAIIIAMKMLKIIMPKFFIRCCICLCLFILS